MFDKLQQNDIVITNNKKTILDYLDNTNKLLNIKIMSKQEFINNYFGYTNKKALYYLINKYNYKYDIAKMYLDNFLYDEMLYKELEENNLIIRTPLFKNRISRIVIINVDIEPSLMTEIQKYNYLILKNKTQNTFPKVKELQTLEEEIEYVANYIRELLKTVSINKLFLVCEDQSYLNTLKRIFKLYNIPLNTKESKNIYGTYSVKKFLEVLKETNDLNTALNSLKKDEIYNAIVDICNNYQFKTFDKTILYMIEEELKQATIVYKQMKEAVNIIGINQMSNEEDYYFILSFNEGIIPKIYKDEDYLSDEQKKNLGLFTSIDKNKLEKDKVINKITNFKNIIITYKLKSQAQDYYPSSLIEEFNLEVIRENNKKYIYSNEYNQLKLASMLDKFIKYNTIDDNLGLLMYNYKELPYLTYDNQYKNIDITSFRNYIDNKITLSYSSLDNFYHCSFKFFLTNILKLNKYEETFMTYIGTLFHDILSLAFKDDFDFEETFNQYIKEKEFTPKEEFFISRLKNKLIEIIDIIKEQNKNSDLTNELYERKVTIHKHDEIDVNFVGIIDKVKYKEFNNKKYVAVIDYKTGMPHIDLNNLNYGLSMQLPIYLYLLNSLFDEEINVAGFYLQKIVPEKLTFQKSKDYDSEVNKLFRLEGFSNDNEEILEKFDKNYNDSKFIKGMKKTSKGTYSHYANILSNTQLNNMINIIDNKIDEAIKKIKNAEFDINPKVIDKKNIGCDFCKFKDICFKKEEDLLMLKSVNYEEFLGKREIIEG